MKNKTNYYMLKYWQQLNMYPDISTTKVFDGINGTKGFFVLMVVITHCLPAGMPLYFLYLFHMPVFLAIGGFLLKENTFQNGLRSFLKKITFRLVIPWIIACVVYLPFQLGNRSLLQLSVSDIIYPFFHLWYIPAYVLGSLMCYAIIKWKIPVWPVLFLCGFITLSWYVIYRDTSKSLTELPLYWFGDKRIYAYLFFFITGFSLRNGIIHFRPLPALLLFIMLSSFLMLTALVYSHKTSVLTFIPYLFFNFSLVLFILVIIGPAPFLQNKLLLLLNKQSLGIYLYHPLLVFIIYDIIGDPQKKHISQWQGFAIGFIVLICILSLIWLVQKWNFTNKYFLGINKQSHKPVLKATLAA